MEGVLQVCDGEAAVRTDPPDELSALKDQFLASLNHEIRTPLSGILGMTDLLLETRLDDEQQEYVRATRLCAESLLEVLNATLEFSALTAGRLAVEEAEFHLPEALRSATFEHSSKAEAKGIRLFTTLDERLPELVIGDALRIRQLLTHLLANALKFTHRGEVEVKASARSVSEGCVELHVAVRDTGIGIPPDQLGLIFESFRQVENGLSRSYAGLGLGLALARKLAHLMGGEIRADSVAGGGSAFSFTVPLRLPHGTAVHPGGIELDERSYRILVVEDHEVSQRVATHVLRRGHYEVDCVSGGREALEAAARGHYDLILMDLQMPGMDGLQATSAIRGINGYARTPILALTANAGEEFRTLCRERGMQGFLAKPVESGELLAAVARHLGLA